MAERLQAIPGVERAAVSTDVPLLGVRQGDAVGLPGTEEGVGARFKRVDPHYFATLDIPVLVGRGFTAHDRAGAPRVAIVNESLARGSPSGLASPIRRRPWAGSSGSQAPCTRIAGSPARPEDIEIIGMIRNERVNDLETPMQEVVYVALLQAPRRELKLIVRTRNDPAAAMPAIREAVGRSTRVCRSATCGRWSR